MSVVGERAASPWPVPARLTEIQRPGEPASAKRGPLLGMYLPERGLGCIVEINTSLQQDKQRNGMEKS